LTDKPLSVNMLRAIIARKAWDLYKKQEIPTEVPSEFYAIAEMAIMETYANVDKMLTDTIRNRLEKLI